MKNPIIALIQSRVGNNKEENVRNALGMLERAAGSGASLAVLPEIFNTPYISKKFPGSAEPDGGHTWKRLSAAAKDLNLFIVGGSIPERDLQGNVYNTSYIFDNTGNQIGKHRKIHLFDVDIEGGQRFRESETLTAGSSITVFDTPYCTMGVAICYDIRFPELFRLMTLQGAKVIIVPGAFNMTTGPAHWELLFRTRALDNQVYAVGVAPARDNDAKYVSYANSLITSPWGGIVDRLGVEEGILIKELDLEKVDKIRRELPLLAHRRTDIYTLKTQKS